MGRELAKNDAAIQELEDKSVELEGKIKSGGGSGGGLRRIKIPEADKTKIGVFSGVAKTSKAGFVARRGSVRTQSTTISSTTL